MSEIMVSNGMRVVDWAKDTTLGAFVLKFHACQFYDFTDVNQKS